MYAEHVLSKDSEEEFTASNTGIKTTPKAEWLFVVGKEGLDTTKWEFVAGSQPSYEGDLLKGRNARSLDELMGMEQARTSMLTSEEMVALRLYTGPMYDVLNKILRGDDNGNPLPRSGNMYTSTILLICSAILKLSKISVPPPEGKVYRGLGGMVLPPSFFDRDAQGFSGGVEMGFMSTSTTRAVAVEYSGLGREQHGIPTIFEINVGKTSMGADLSWLSQFQHEKEMLYGPLTHLQVRNGSCDACPML